MQASAPLKTRAGVWAHLTPLVRVFAMLPQVARWVCALAGSLWSLRLGLGVYAFHVTNQLERPGYTVVRQLSGGVELRAYPEYVVAEAAYRKPPSFKAATTSGFRACASFILLVWSSEFGPSTASFNSVSSSITPMYWDSMSRLSVAYLIGH